MKSQTKYSSKGLMMDRRYFLKTAGLGVASLKIAGCTWSTKQAGQPNIIWINVEDTSRHFGYNGEKLVSTPNVDRLAREGVVFTNAYITAPVCSPSRSAAITGMYQTSVGVHHHRSSRGTEKIYLLSHIKLIPKYFQEAGYYTSNTATRLSWDRPGKEDYNFVYDRKEIYNGSDWSGRKPGQPFFAQIQLQGGKNRGAKVPNPVDPDEVTLPPYYPDDPVIREDWARYLNSVQFVDIMVGKLIDRLEQENLLDNTIIIFHTDHGVSHARGKQFCYDEGARIPFIIWGPKYVGKGVREDLIQHIDMAATSMYFAGIDIPDYMESNPLFGPDYKEREYVVTARDRCDETVDRIRGIRKGKYKYIRNFHPKRPHLQPCAYKDNKPILKQLRKLHEEGNLNDLQERLLFPTERATEELYDLEKDPFELNNLAAEPSMKDIINDMRSCLEEWVRETGDLGQYPESDAQYDSSMEAYLEGFKQRNKQYFDEVTRNIRLMKKWKMEGI